MEETAPPGFLLPLSSGSWAFSRWMRHACVSNMKSIKGETGSEHVHMFGQSGHTCAGHLERVRVGPVVAVPADAVDGAFAGGAAVDGTLQAGLVSLSGLEGAGRAG